MEVKSNKEIQHSVSLLTDFKVGSSSFLKFSTSSQCNHTFQVNAAIHWLKLRVHTHTHKISLRGELFIFSSSMMNASSLNTDNPPHNNNSSNHSGSNAEEESRLVSLISMAASDALSKTEDDDNTRTSCSGGDLSSNLKLKVKAGSNNSNNLKRDVEGTIKDSTTTSDNNDNNNNNNNKMEDNHEAPCSSSLDESSNNYDVKASILSIPNNNNQIGHSVVSPMTLVTLGKACRARRRSSTGVVEGRLSSGTQARAKQLVSGKWQLQTNRDGSSSTAKSDSGISYSLSSSPVDLGYGDTPTAAATKIDTNNNAKTAVPSDLGYGDDDGDISNTMQPPTKRPCRYQRRNSFVIPETSRAQGRKASNFSRKAMEFIYGVPPLSSSSPIQSIAEQPSNNEKE